MAVSSKMNRMPNCVCVCIDKDDYSGRIYHSYSETPVEFVDIAEMLATIEAVLNEVNFPEAKIKPRHFKKTQNRTVDFGIEFENKCIQPKDMADLKGEKGTFIINVTSRDFAHMQGAIFDASADKEYLFNSDIQLLKIISGACTTR
ncbi:MAG: hypothetical protein K6E79_08860 [Pseudobutyrivibrio sp.]|nr:hypothetical protein [Pseudobutyrivibrio sp.]